MDAHKVLSFTPREFAIMMRAELERKFDRYEEYSHFALMREKAHREKRPKASDLFKRPIDDETAKSKAETMREQMEWAKDYLAQFEQFRDGINEREEGANG